MLFGLSGISQAATIGFNSENNFVNLGDVFSIDLMNDAFPVTQGGGVNLFYDETIVNVLSISIDSAVWNFVNDEGTINNSIGTVSDILVSSFNFSGDPSGNFIMASIEFQAVGFGISSLSMTESTINPWASDGSEVNPDFLNGSVTVSAVPIPGALWLFVSGFLLIARFKRSDV